MANPVQETAPLMENNGQPKDSAIDIPEEEQRPGPGCCIFEVPIRFRQAKEEAYTPQLISIGPLHHGNKNLAQMEPQKKKSYHDLLRLTSKQKLEEFEIYQDMLRAISKQKTEEFEGYIKCHLTRICRCYEVEFLNEMGSSKVIGIILYDAAFIIMLFLREFAEKRDNSDDDEDDFLNPVLVKIKLLNFLKRDAVRSFNLRSDLMLLENQLPFFVLEDLYNIAFPTSKKPSFLNLSCLYFDVREYPSLEQKKIKHFTDLIRHHALRACPPNVGMGNHNMYSATRLREAGVTFNCASFKRVGVMFNGVSYKCYKIDGLEYDDAESVGDVPESPAYGLLKVQFEKGVLKLLTIDMEYETEIRFRNLMAFEQHFCPKEAYFSSYIKLLDSLVDTDEDVDLLVNAGIVVNKLGSSHAAATMINKLAVGVIHSTLIYGDIGEKLNKYYKSSWNRRCASLKHVYFSDLWRGTATVAAFIVVVLTLIQTLLAILDRAMPTN